MPPHRRFRPQLTGEIQRVSNSCDIKLLRRCLITPGDITSASSVVFMKGEVDESAQNRKIENSDSTPSNRRIALFCTKPSTVKRWMGSISNEILTMRLDKVSVRRTSRGAIQSKLTDEQVLDAFRCIRSWVRGDQRAPHKSLLLLVALAEVQRGGRWISYPDLEPPAETTAFGFRTAPQIVPSGIPFLAPAE